MNILIADDALYIREQARFYLKDIKVVTLFEAANGKEALSLIQNEKIDLMLVDTVMPEKSGIQITKEALALKPSLKVLALSTQEKGATLTKMKEAGARGYLKKPFTQEQINALVKEYS